MKKENPKEFEAACLYDEKLRQEGGDKYKFPRYISRELRPLREVDFISEDDLIKYGFENECEGMCGVWALVE